MKKLRDRWATPEGTETYDAILKALSRNGQLTEVNGIGVHDGKLDLRGIVLPASFSLKKVVLDNLDLSYATLYASEWNTCEFCNVKFSVAKADYCKFWACKFTDVTFEKTYLNQALMNGTLNGDTGYFKNVQFVDCNLSNTIYTNTLFEDCHFSNCKLDQVDFNGSRFVNCKFTGKISEVIFRGWPLINKKLFPNVEPLKNPMDRVDFTGALMESVVFIDSIDLTNCTFPPSEDYITIKRNRNRLFEEARRIIESTWEGMPKRIGLGLIDKYYLGPRSLNIKGEIIDKTYLVNFDKDFGFKFFDLIKRLNNELNT